MSQPKGLPVFRITSDQDVDAFVSEHKDLINKWFVACGGQLSIDLIQQDIIKLLKKNQMEDDAIVRIMMELDTTELQEEYFAWLKGLKESPEINKMVIMLKKIKE